MNIFEKFSTKEELLQAVESAIVSETVPAAEPGGEPSEVYFLRGDADRADPEAEAETVRRLRQRAADAESRLQEQIRENARLAATNEEFSKYNPEKQRDEINRLLEEVGRLRADNKGLAEQIAPLNQLIADYKRKEEERTIDKALIDEAARLGVRPEAMRDVMFRRSLLTVSDIGTVETKEDGIGIADFMKAEYEASPLWHPQSQGGGSAPGAAEKPDAEELYREARLNHDLDAMFANAPKFRGNTLS